MGVFQHKAGKCWSRASQETAFNRQLKGPEVDSPPPDAPRYIEPLLGREIIVMWQPSVDERTEI